MSHNPARKRRAPAGRVASGNQPRSDSRRAYAGAMPLSELAQQLVAALTDANTGDPDEHAMALALPYGMPAADRAEEISRHQAIVDELRAAGWPVEVDIGRAAT